MSQWRRAWLAGDARELAGFYARDAIVTLPDASGLRGAEQVETGFLQRFPADGEFDSGISQFAMGGTLAFSMGWFRYSAHPDGGEPREVVGTHVVVFRRHGRRWLILHQAFLPGPGSSSASSSVGEAAGRAAALMG